jgi:hypothetical protein
MLTIPTESPSDLLAAIKKAIDEGHIKTWEYDKDGDFTHTPAQWHEQAWLHPVEVDGALTFGIIHPKGKAVTWAIFGVYQGRFIEMLIEHFHTKFKTATATSHLVVPPDRSPPADSK